MEYFLNFCKRKDKAKKSPTKQIKGLVKKSNHGVAIDKEVSDEPEDEADSKAPDKKGGGKNTNGKQKQNRLTATDKEGFEETKHKPGNTSTQLAYNEASNNQVSDKQSASPSRAHIAVADIHGPLLETKKTATTPSLQQSFTAEASTSTPRRHESAYESIFRQDPRIALRKIPKHCLAPIASAIVIKSNSDSGSVRNSIFREFITNLRLSRLYFSDGYSPPPAPDKDKKKRRVSFSSCSQSPRRNSLFDDSISNERRHSLNEDYTSSYEGRDSLVGTYPSAPHDLDSSHHYNTYPFKKRHQEQNYRDWNNPNIPIERKVLPSSVSDRLVSAEFCHKLGKAKQLFNCLRGLPKYGHKLWFSYFGRTFNLHSGIWTYQIHNRDILFRTNVLQRWQIGEIASKMGQLYYFFYVRTSDIYYLHEAFIFYHIIRWRSYYTDADKEDTCELMVNKLRYYKRFIKVCLLLKKIKLVHDLVEELQMAILEYGSTYNPDDLSDWNKNVEQITLFIQSEPVLSVVKPENCVIILSNRLNFSSIPYMERTPQMNLTLREIVIVGSNSKQAVFSELSMDMYRILQTFETESLEDILRTYDDDPPPLTKIIPLVPNSRDYSLGNTPLRRNVHKCVLYKPSPSQILLYLASAFDNLPENGAFLIYISADGHVVQPSKPIEGGTGYDRGGLVTTSMTDICRESTKDVTASPSLTTNYQELQLLHPGDLYPLTRRPMFIIVDSDHSYLFQNIPRHFGRPLVVLMSPVDVPAPYHEPKLQGNLLTLFLHMPIVGFSFCCEINTITMDAFDAANKYIDKFMNTAAEILNSTQIDPDYVAFIGDPYLRVMILRYIFCAVTLRMHRVFNLPTHLPLCSPPLPDEVLQHPELEKRLTDLAVYMEAKSYYYEYSAAGPSHRN